MEVNGYLHSPSLEVPLISLSKYEGWADYRGGFDAVERGFAPSGKRNNYSTVVQPVSWSHYRMKRSDNSSTDESNV